ncbi:hypothetical protein LIER_17313 [Lithospermum erythrorhizon]|uniref:RNase H type-1 domain-containing protein n=1 Tax=Lithospermum erythrorhizon TaxID=34254 RepID=A0AAV3QC34_LITER
MLHSWLPVDEMMIKKGISMASKCICCCQTETLEHVFFSNPIAEQLWDYYAGLVGIKHTKFTNIRQVLRVWSLSIKNKGHIRQLIPVVLLWVLWEARNKAKQAAEPYCYHRICNRVTTLLIAISKASMNKAEYWTGESFLASQLGISVLVPRAKQMRLLSWVKPQVDQLKLNIDASYKQGRAGYGGIIRNSQGELVFAFGFQGCSASALQAEVDALLGCLRRCVSEGYGKLHIEVDSLQLVNMIQQKSANWTMQSKITQISTLIQASGSTLKHIFRERNMAADWIAKQVWKTKQEKVWLQGTSDGAMQRLMQLESSGLPQLRLG